MDVDTEAESKIQDWLSRAGRLEAIGCNMDFAHGNV
jgi:hypothetical protein